VGLKYFEKRVQLVRKETKRKTHRVRFKYLFKDTSMRNRDQEKEVNEKERESLI
jgi:exopolysaccharide biosynthesis protein